MKRFVERSKLPPENGEVLPRQETEAKVVLASSENLLARGYKTFFMLNSVEHEILNAHKYKNINALQLF